MPFTLVSFASSAEIASVAGAARARRARARDFLASILLRLQRTLVVLGSGLVLVQRGERVFELGPDRAEVLRLFEQRRDVARVAQHREQG